MFHADPFAYLSVGPIARIKILLSVRRDEIEHGPESFVCTICRHRWLEALEVLDSKSTDQARVKSISMLWLDGHIIATECGSCEGCRVELDSAARAAVLAESKIDVQIGLGPIHNGKVCKGGCKACRNWAGLMRAAEVQLSKAGFSSQRWLYAHRS
jgi:hypothetical protein